MELNMNETQVIRIRYWAAARSAAGRETDEVATTTEMTLADVLSEVLRRHPGTSLEQTLAVCSVLLGDRPIATEDPGDVLVPPGSTLEFLPPFAGG